MNKDKLKNIFLGVIAINLTLITLIQLEIFPPKAYASETSQPINTNYGLVPLNENGNVNVEVVGGVDITAIYGGAGAALGMHNFYLKHN
jgi:hypothetical protein|tara:strand:+ start:204 stop:470 length:267 start_codon:yes stop_codon:yes gene_type:complete